MLKSDFWKIIDQSRQQADGDAEAQMVALRLLLRGLEADALVGFAHWFSDYHNRAYTWGLWGAAYLIGGGCSDDGFMDFRGWLISRGEKTFESALANPDALAKWVTDEDGECQVEGFQYLAAQLWAEKTGKPEIEFPRQPVVAARADPDGKAWSEDELDGLFPKLAKRFG